MSTRPRVWDRDGVSAYERQRRARLALELPPCACGSPVVILKTGQCSACYQVAFRARLAEIRRVARAEGSIVAGTWQRERPPADVASKKREHNARAWKRRRERLAAAPEYRERERVRRNAEQRAPARRAYKAAWLAARMTDPEFRARQVALERVRRQRKRLPQPTPEQREIERRQRALEHERRLIDDPDFRRQTLAQERERANAQAAKARQRHRKRMATDPEYAARYRAKRAQAKRERQARLRADPERAPHFRAQHTNQERERRARRRAERKEIRDAEARD